MTDERFDLGRPRRAPRAPAGRRRALERHPLGAARAQLHDAYILAETADGLILVDQHAAHERLVYERMKAELAASGVARQGLLLPEVVELDPAAVEQLHRSARAELAGLGLVLERFGAEAVLVRELPALLGSADVGRLVRDLADDLATIDQARQPARGAPSGVRDARLPRQRARRAPPQPRRDERAAAPDGSDPAQRPVQPRPADLRQPVAGRHRAAVRPPLTRRPGPWPALPAAGTLVGRAARARGDALEDDRRAGRAANCRCRARAGTLDKLRATRHI